MAPLTPQNVEFVVFLFGSVLSVLYCGPEAFIPCRVSEHQVKDKGERHVPSYGSQQHVPKTKDTDQTRVRNETKKEREAFSLLMGTMMKESVQRLPKRDVFFVY